MSMSKQSTSYFDDDFEVTYEEDPYKIDLNTTKLEKAPKKSKKKQKPLKEPLYTRSRTEISDEELQDSYYDDDDFDDYENRRNKRQSSTSGSHADDSRRSSGSRADNSRRSSSGRKKGYKPTKLAAPIQKGGKAVYNISKSLVRNLSAFLIIAIICLMCYDFYRSSALYGDIESMIQTRDIQITLSAYAAVALFFILFELISLLWTMTKVRVRDEFGSHKEDVGRGLFSFIFIYVCSHASFLFCSYIPELHEALVGVKGALNVFGSMHNTLFGICIAGVISCLFRKYSLSL